LKDILEDADGNPKPGDTTEIMKKELKRLKIVENREEPFANKETKTYYTRNDDNRSRYDNWRKNIRSDGYRRSETNPKYFRTASRNKWIRDSSRFGGRSNSRPFRDGSRLRSKSRNGDKSVERPKSDLLKKVEAMEKDNVAIKTSIKNIEEMMKKVTINTKFVEEEIVIDVKYVEKDIENMMIIDSGAPVSLMSSAWFNNYLKEAKVDNEEVQKSSSNRRFRLGKTPYISTEKVTFPIVMNR